MVADILLGRQCGLGQRLADEVLDLLEQAALTRRDHRDGNAGLPGAAGAPDAMDINFRVVGQVVVEDVGNVVNVEAASGHVRRHQHLDLVLAEPVEGPFAGFLAQVAVQRFGGEAAPGQFIGQFPGSNASPYKDQGAGHRFDLEETSHRGQFIGLVNQVVALFDGLQCDLGALDQDGLRVAHVAVGQAADGGRQGGGEEGGLAVCGGIGQDGLDVFDEAHRKHLVGFVENDCLDMADVEGVAFEQVDQAAGGADHHVHAAVETADLRTVGLPAVDGQHAHFLHFAVIVNGAGHL